MKNIAYAAMLALALCAPAKARLIEIVAEGGPVVSMASAGQPREIVVLQPSASSLAEPEMLAMMLLGLCLIGYKASRDSSEKFE